ncbi:hypothetical protein NM208_g4217 [Fusarium decemcellulare]|uniref:Uncharacterized protein n=1 Tax=Fusarium decemcellulare TaxID=57161 RepID=A0ACC1SLU2_9HYPO|nr:hypothetical protein NM208_g4217 [Fusarium decemcellulare]
MTQQAASEFPSVRWGIIGTGMISSWFVEDLVMPYADAKATHIIKAIGSSSVDKGTKFAKTHCPLSEPKVYGSYHDVYKDPNVDIVYIGTPHAFHKQSCLDAINEGKAVLCEKAFTLNAREAREVFDAAAKKQVYVAEAMWLRHRPLVQQLLKLIHQDKVIGDVFRTFSDFGVEKDIPNLPSTSRYKQVELGAGTLLDLGIYSLTWALISLDPNNPSNSETPAILASQTHEHGVEVSSSVILIYPSTGRQAIVSSTTKTYGNPDMAARIQGTKGSIEVHGPLPSFPESFTIYPKFMKDSASGIVERGQGETFRFPAPGRGYRFEADNTALDLLAGKLESDIMPWSETIRIMEIMDEIRRQGGTVYPCDVAE